jgi:hypothetical protein
MGDTKLQIKSDLIMTKQGGGGGVALLDKFGNCRK